MALEAVEDAVTMSWQLKMGMKVDRDAVINGSGPYYGRGLNW